jgi:hypothetical protein
MPPKEARGRGGGGGNRGKEGTGDHNTAKQATNQSLTTNKQQDQQQQRSFSISPLILEGVKSMTKVDLNKFLKKYSTEAKVQDIQANRSGTFTIYTSDVKSFNYLLNNLSMHLNDIQDQPTVVYIPRSIQRILEVEKIAYVKRIDLEITEDEITEALSNKKFEFQSVTRLHNNDKVPLKTVKIVFNDSHNRNTFVKIGLQIDAMHFVAERANQNNIPTQCYKCMRFGHVTKYCNGQNNVCARCGDKHRSEQCTNLNKKLFCCNCKGEHTATSKECPMFKEQQRKMQRTIDSYTTSSSTISTISPNLNDSVEFPSLIKSSQNSLEKIQVQIIDALTEKLLEMVEHATQKIYETLSQKLEQITQCLLAQTTTKNVDPNELTTTIEQDTQDIGKNIQSQYIKSPQCEETVAKNNSQQGAKRTNSSTNSPSDSTTTKSNKQAKKQQQK